MIKWRIEMNKKTKKDKTMQTSISADQIEQLVLDHSGSNANPFELLRKLEQAVANSDKRFTSTYKHTKQGQE